MRLFVVALLLLMPLAGCLDSPADPATGAGLSAMEARTVAQKEAKLWDSGAQLAGVMYLEGEAVPQNGTPAAPEFADGRADAYAFFFTAPEQESAWNVTVGGNGRVLFAGPEDTEDLVPLRDWRVDSPALFATLRAEAEGFADRVDSSEDGNMFGFLVTDLDEDNFDFNGTLWIVLEGSDKFYMHIVDASNGTLLGSFDFAMIIDGMIAESGSFSGTLTALASSASHAFELENDHEGIGFRLAAETSVPLDSVRVNVTGPGGSHEEFVLALLPGDSAYFEIEPATAGNWEARVDLQGFATRYTLDYCTSGIPATFASPFSSPCFRVQQ